MKKPVTVTAAIAIAIIYSIVLAGMAAIIFYDFLGNHGHIGSEDLTGQAASGLIEVVIAMAFGAGLLLTGVYQLLTRRKSTLIIVPFGILIIIGCVGETIDIIGTATLSSNLIGLGILASFLLPVWLLLTPSSRNWSKGDSK